MLKYIMVPVAAFAVTATGASAFSGDLLNKLDLNLTNDQIAAFEEVHELKEAGADREEIREVFEEAGLDHDDLQEVREAVREYKQEMREAVKEAVEDNDYDAFLEAVEGTKMADKIDSEADFDRLVEAHELREAGDREGAREIMEELGFDKPGKNHRDGKRGHNQN